MKGFLQITTPFGEKHMTRRGSFLQCGPRTDQLPMKMLFPSAIRGGACGKEALSEPGRRCCPWAAPWCFCPSPNPICHLLGNSLPGRSCKSCKLLVSHLCFPKNCNSQFCPPCCCHSKLSPLPSVGKGAPPASTSSGQNKTSKSTGTYHAWICKIEPRTGTLLKGRNQTSDTESHS